MLLRPYPKGGSAILQQEIPSQCREYKTLYLQLNKWYINWAGSVGMENRNVVMRDKDRSTPSAPRKGGIRKRLEESYTKRLGVFLIGVMVVMNVSLVNGAEPIKIGAFYSLSGPAAAIGTPTKLVTEMVVEKINKEG